MESEKLDRALALLPLSGEFLEQYHKPVFESGIAASGDEALAIVAQLEKRRLIRMHPATLRNKDFQILPLGVEFLKAGGFSAENKRTEQDRKIQNWSFKLLILSVALTLISLIVSVIALLS